MNVSRRAQIQEAFKASVEQAMDEFRTQLETVRDDEQDYYDRMPEAIQMSSKGDDVQEGIDIIDAVIDNCDSHCESMDELVSSVEDMYDQFGMDF